MTNEVSQEANIASHLPRMAAAQPETTSIMFAKGKHYDSWNYDQLNKTCDAYAHVLAAAGVQKGQKALLMLTAGPELIATAFALFKMGVLPVLLDPGMGKQNMLNCINHVKPDVFIGIPKAQLARVIYSSAFASVKFSFTATGWFPLVPSLAKLAPQYTEEFPVTAVAPNDTAAILFTSGSTGKAKGVVYQHSMFQGQVKALKKLFHFEPGEVDMPGYPLFALFDAALGMTTIIPKLDPSKPANCDPLAIIDTIQKYDVAMCQGSPAIWSRVAAFCKEENIKLPSLKKVVTFGAPVSVSLLRSWRELLDEKADVYTPYGATECLPVALISGSEVLDDTAELTAEGAGTCVGHTNKGIQVKIIKITDDPIPEYSNSLVLETNQVGEIVVHGDVVTQEYYEEPKANALAKMADGKGGFWHRMGDLGYVDEQGRLWFCGRKAHRIETAAGTIFPVQAEGMANNHPAVFRSALVGVGKPGQQKPVLIVQLETSAIPSDEKGEELLKKQILGRYEDHETFKVIDTLYFHKNFPVDPRHNVKIHREELAVWAAAQE